MTEYKTIRSSVGDYLVSVGDEISQQINQIISSMDLYGGYIELPEGSFTLDSGIVFDKPVKLSGAGAGNESLTTLVIAQGITGITLSDNCVITDITLQSNTTQLSGCFINSINKNRVVVDRCFFWKHNIGINIDGGSEISIENCQLFNGTASSVSSESCGIRLGASNYTGAVTLDKVYLKGESPQAQPSSGIEVRFVDVVNLYAVTSILQGDALRICPGANQTTSLLYAQGCTFDTSVNGLSVKGNGGRFIRSSFSDCWFGENTSSGIVTSGQGVMGGISISGCHIYNNHSCGINLDMVGTKGLNIIGCFIAGSGLAGARLSSGCTSIIISASIIGPVGAAVGNLHGVLKAPGISGMIANSIVSGNTANNHENGPL